MKWPFFPLVKSGFKNKLTIVWSDWEPEFRQPKRLTLKYPMLSNRYTVYHIHIYKRVLSCPCPTSPDELVLPHQNSKGFKFFKRKEQKQRQLHDFIFQKVKIRRFHFLYHKVTERERPTSDFKVLRYSEKCTVSSFFLHCFNLIL